MADSYVCSKARIRCTYGDKISTLTIFPDRAIWLTGQPQANISDHISMRNIAPFGKCRTVSYPATGSATAAANGKLTPMPCVPNTPFPWMGGKNDVLLDGAPALLKSSSCKCMYGGTITFVRDGQIDGTYSELEQEEAVSREDMDLEEEMHLTPEELLDGLQLALDAAGMFPGLGAVPDLLNACISLCRGNWADAALSLFAAVPGIGDAAGAAKIMKNGAKLAKKSKNAKNLGKCGTKGGDVISNGSKEGRNRELARARAERSGTKFSEGRSETLYDTAPDKSSASKFSRDDYLSKSDQYEQDELKAWESAGDNRQYLILERKNSGLDNTLKSPDLDIKVDPDAKNNPFGGHKDITEYMASDVRSSGSKVADGKITPEEVLKNQALNKPKVDYKPEASYEKKEVPIVGSKFDYKA